MVAPQWHLASAHPSALVIRYKPEEEQARESRKSGRVPPRQPKRREARRSFVALNPGARCRDRDRAHAIFEFSPPERLAVQEAARCIAILEAIDRHLDARGIVDKEGAPRYLLNHRSRIPRQLEQWLQKISAAIERTPASDPEPLHADLPEYVRALQGIALGRDPGATARDRLAALRELLKLEKRGTSSYLEASAWGDPELQRRWARASRADELERLQSREEKFGITE